MRERGLKGGRPRALTLSEIRHQQALDADKKLKEELRGKRYRANKKVGAAELNSGSGGEKDDKRSISDKRQNKQGFIAVIKSRCYYRGTRKAKGSLSAYIQRH